MFICSFQLFFYLNFNFLINMLNIIIRSTLENNLIYMGVLVINRRLYSVEEIQNVRGELIEEIRGYLMDDTDDAIYLIEELVDQVIIDYRNNFRGGGGGPPPSHLHISIFVFNYKFIFLNIFSNN